MSASFYDLMKYAKTGIAAPDMTAYDKMRALAAFGGGTVKTLTGQPPLSFKSTGTPLISWSMKGNGSQSGTPTPDNPIRPDFVGKKVGADWTIPIACAGQTTPVYLGQVQTVRRINKLVLTGEEKYESKHLDVGLMSLHLSGQAIRTVDRITVMSSHYEKQANVNLWSYVANKRLCFHSVTADTLLYIRDTTFSTIAGFQQYLRNEYAAGHPVTIWYVLANEQTGIVNEPLAKIGNYADELSSADAGVTIPTAKGQNTMTVDTELQPSEMTITYKG